MHMHTCFLLVMHLPVVVVDGAVYAHAYGVLVPVHSDDFLVPGYAHA